LVSDRRDLLRLYRMGVRPQLLKEVPGTIVETPGGAPYDTSDMLLALLVPRLHACGHIWDGRFTAVQPTLSQGTTSGYGRSTAVQAAAHTEEKAAAHTEAEDSAEDDQAYIVPVVEQSRVSRPRAEVPTAGVADLSVPPKKQRTVRICTQAGYEEFAQLNIEDLNPDSVVGNAPCTQVEPDWISRAYWSHLTSRRSATMREHVLCAQAASWHRVFDRGKGYWYRVFDRGKGMGADSRDYFCVLSSGYTIFRFSCYTYTCRCTCNN